MWAWSLPLSVWLRVAKVKLRYALSLIVAVFVGSVIVNAPAGLLVGPMAEQHVYLEGVSGSVWRGKAQNLSARANGEVITWGQVEWHLSPLSVLSLSPSLAFASELGGQWMQAKVTLDSLESIQLANLQGRVPAAIVRLFAPLSVDGAFEFNFPNLQWSQSLGVLALNGSLRWVDAVWQTQTDRVLLGTYELALNSKGQDIVGLVTTVKGAVQATGELRAKEQNYTVDLLIEPDGPAEQRLRQNLSLIAQPEGNGLRIKLSGQY